MSFILDALRKSESERQSESVVQVSRAPLAIYRDRVPTWAYAVIVLLGAAVTTLGGFWWINRPDEAPVRAETTPAAEETLVSSRSMPAGPGEQAGPARNAPAVNSAAPAVTAVDTRAAPTLTNDEMPTDGEVPKMSVLLSQGIALPELDIDTHVANQATPQRRLARINGKIYREGDIMAEGPRIVEITEQGVIMNYSGRQFLLPRPGA